jgi:hexosaminidase
LSVFLAAATVSPRQAYAEAEAPAGLVPWPQSLKINGGDVKMTAASRMVFAGAALAPLARVLGDEIYLATAVRLKAAPGSGGAGDIVLAVDPQMKGEQYALSVTDRAVVRGGNYRAVAWGAVTLLQAIEPAGAGALRVARMTVEDKPVAAYRGLLIDVARQWHPVETLRPVIEMCRLYKINYIQLHLNDQQSFTFPSKAFPSLASSDKGQRRTYTLEEITALVRYADERGVTLVPEMEGPGHHSGALRSLWGRKGTSCMDMGSEKTYEGMDVLIGELCEVFASSPYIHIGADECDLSGVGESDEEKAFMAKHGLKGREGLYNHYIVRMNEIIRKHGRQTICWEGFRNDGAGGVKIPQDILVMPFESTYNPANNLVAHGYTVINTAWKPLYVVGDKKWPAQYIYENWNLWLWEHHINTRCHIQLKKTDPVLGAQMCAWEQPADVELPSTRERLHAMSERIWNPEAGQTYADFAARALKADTLLDRLLGRVDIQVQGLSGRERRGYYYFWDPITLKLSCPPIGAIHYTLDGSEPTLESPAYAGPLALTKEQTRSEKLFFNSRTKRYDASGNVVCVKARIFDAGGRPVGDAATLGRYWHRDPEELKKEDQENEPKKSPQETPAS